MPFFIMLLFKSFTSGQGHTKPIVPAVYEDEAAFCLAVQD